MDLRTQGGGRVSWDKVRELHGLIYTTKCKIDSMDIYTLPNVKYIASGKQPHSTGSGILQCLLMGHFGRADFQSEALPVCI